ncbi:MAG: SPOR domain-containing protein [Candidatus Omnitrophota bacterium]|nr:SPOR domain-containing protein [Candidatus Omnitrophota bacterium]
MRRSWICIANTHRKIIPLFIFCASIFFPVFCWPAELDALKADFLRGNYRRVILEGQAQVERINLRGSDELSCILGLSYLKESDLAAARESFKRVLRNSSGKFKTQANLGLADTYLIGGQFQEAENIYNKLIDEDPNISLKAAILYRLSQSGFKKGNNSQGNEYLSKLKRDFPISLELRLTRAIGRIEPIFPETGEYSVQVGFFTNSENADSLKHKLLAKGYPAYVERVGAGNRVRVGRLKARKEALDLENKLTKEGFPTKVCPQ